MTEEQTARCDALARRIAELDPDWCFAGASLYWPDDAAPWRALWPCGGRWVCYRSVGDGDEGTTSARADAVPDWRDPATLGAILLSLGDVLDIHYRAPLWHHRDELRWRADSVSSCGRAGVSGPWCETRAESILAAKVAQLGGDNA